VLDPILQAYVERYETPEQIAAEHHFDLRPSVQVVKLVERSEYKRQQAAPGAQGHQQVFWHGPPLSHRVKVSGISKMREELNAASYKPYVFLFWQSAVRHAHWPRTQPRRLPRLPRRPLRRAVFFTVPTPPPGPGDPVSPSRPGKLTATTPTKQTVEDFFARILGYDSSRLWQIQAILPTPAQGVSRVLVLVKSANPGPKGQTAQLSFFTLPGWKVPGLPTLCCPFR